MKRLILLADDSPTIQRLVAQMFAGSDFDVVSVSNGDAAVRKFDEVQPDLVLADIYMPGKNGYEVCAAVKKHEQLGDTPVVLLAGAFDAFDEETASHVGAAAHITKPFEPQALLNLVSSLAPKSSARTRTATATAAAAAAVVATSPVAPPPAPPMPPIESAPATEETVVANVLDLPRPEVPKSGLSLVSELAATAPEPTPSASALTAEPEPAPSEPAPTPAPAPAPAAGPAPAALSPAVAPASKPAAAEAESAADNGDLLGLQDIFKPASAPLTSASVTDAEIERIAERVIQKLSTQVIENVAWDVVPDITTKVLKEELKRRT